MNETRTLSPHSVVSTPKQTEELYGNSAAEKPAPVLSKQDFVRRYKAGEFGNASPTWNNFDELYDWKTDTYRHRGPFHLRNRVAQGKSWYNVPLQNVREEWMHRANEVGPHNLYISAMAPHWANVIQGELWQPRHDSRQPSDGHLYFYYSDLPDLPMRDALREKPLQLTGLDVVLLLRRSLCPNSWEWLNQLLANYPGHVIEFSTFGVEWGTVPGYNTVFWEVRNY